MYTILHMKLLRRITLALMTLMMPATSYACGAGMDVGNGSFFQTPLTIRGQYVFVHRVSRRHLLKDLQEQVTTQVFRVRSEV